MKRKTGTNELAWALGIILCTLGICLCTKADIGLSMIAAPPYILHLKLIKLFEWYSQGTSEYFWQGKLLIVLVIIVRRFKVKYLLSFVTAVISGLVLDAWFMLFGGNGAYESLAVRIIAFAAGEAITAFAIAFFFRTRMPQQIYELAVAEISEHYAWDINRVKLINDIIMLALAVLLALLLNGNLQGVGAGTVLITLVNAPLIKFFGKIIDKVLLKK